MKLSIFLLWCLIRFVNTSIPLGKSNQDNSTNQTYTRHSNNWALIVRSLDDGIYIPCQATGYPRQPDGMPCNPRNCFPGEIFNQKSKGINLYGEDVEVDYRGTEVTVENFIRVLTGRHEPGTPASRRLDIDEHSNLFIYMTGHGGDEFLKFQDFEELNSPDIGDAIEEMDVKKRYHELFFMVDTCQAGTLANSIKSRNVVTAGSSKKGENSYAKGSDMKIGVSLIDRFTSATLDFLQDTEIGSSSVTLDNLFSSYSPRQLHSTPVFRTDTLNRPITEVPVTDFLGSVLYIEAINEFYPLTGRGEKDSQIVDLSKTIGTFSLLIDSRPISSNYQDINGEQRHGRIGYSYRFISTLFMLIIATIILSILE